MERPDISTWEVETLRLTAFLTPTADLGERDWWRRVVGEVPESTNQQPRIRSYEESGQFDSGKLILRYTLDRIDWLLAPLSPEGIPVNVPVIGPFVDTIDKFVNLMESWSQMDIPAIMRLAFGSVLLRPVADRTTGYLQSSTYLPFSLDAENSSDFQYQINRPRRSKNIDSLSINRLSKWSIIAWQFVPIRMGVPNIGAEPGPRSYECRLELDLNTEAEYQRELPKDQLRPIFRELVDLGKEIASIGDVP
jgi:hypothetical protein